MKIKIGEDGKSKGRERKKMKEKKRDGREGKEKKS